MAIGFQLAICDAVKVYYLTVIKQLILYLIWLILSLIDLHLSYRSDKPRKHARLFLMNYPQYLCRIILEQACLSFQIIGINIIGEKERQLQCRRHTNVSEPCY